MGMTDQKNNVDNVWEDEGDDVWGDDDNVSYDRAIAEREWSRLHENFGNSGYLEGIEEGKEGTLQQGFNQGWSEGVQYGHELGRLRGLISPLLEYIQRLPAGSADQDKKGPLPDASDRHEWIENAVALVKELVEIDIAAVFDKDYFDDGRGPNSKANDKAAGGCCGSSKDSTASSCCKSDSQSAPVPVTLSPSCSKEGGACHSTKSASGGCQSKKVKSELSKPDQVLGEYRARILELLKQVSMDHLLTPA